MNALRTYFRPVGQRQQAGHGINEPLAHDTQSYSARYSLGLPGPRSPPMEKDIRGNASYSEQGLHEVKYQNWSERHPLGEHADSDAVLQLKADMMVEYVRQQQQRRMWSTNRPGEGVVLKKARSQYVCAPQSLAHYHRGLFEAVREMNVKASPSSTGYFYSTARD